MAAPAGKCTMRGSCGKKGLFGRDLPCPYDGPPVEPDNPFREQLVSICGPQFATGPACCTSDQVTSLRDNIKQAEAFIATCPACRNNFLSFFCTFTCSPDQGSFTNITSTQTTSEGKEAVKSLSFFVSEPYASGFFDSCKEVKFGASNGYAMDFIGGGAKDYHGFLKFLGDEKAMGSPFQIDYPSSTPPEFTPLNLPPRSCSDPDLSNRCACMDCPQTCPDLPPQSDPYNSPTCHVGLISCLTFVLLLVYSLAVFAFFTGFIAQIAWRKRKERSYERVALSTDAASLNNQQPSPSSHTRPLVGASSLALYFDNDSGPPPETPRHHLGRGASLLDPIETMQPPQYKLNKILRRTFYRIGHFCASWPWLTFFFVFLTIGLLNMGWKKFAVETDPVRLWVAPNSESKVQKDFFDQNFGPFFRAEGGIFVTSPARPTSFQNSTTIAEDLVPVLSWERLKWWEKVESDIYALQTEDGVTLDDVCFKPSGPDGACVIQSILGWYNGLENWDEHTWKEQLLNCADKPSQVECLPPFQQPLIPDLVLGGVENGNWLDAKAIITTFVVSNSLDPEVVSRAESWERVLRQYLSDLANDAPEQSGSQVFFSTGVSLEEELNKSTNTDVRIIVLSYLLMFFYVSLTLGSNAAGADEETLVGSLVTWLIGLPSFFRRKNVTASPVVNANATPRATWYPRLPRRLFMGSKFTLGLFGIALVILSVTASVGLFSFLGIKVTLIIAEVIPFLVLAVGVDNVFILVHELDRQNAQHGPNAKGIPDPTSPQSNRSPFGSSHDSADADSVPLHLYPEERVARSLAKMGPSILLSSLTETVAFALGALVPMPAVRNFALYAAGSVFLNALMQVTVFVSALSLDLRRVEASRLDCLPCIRIPPRIALSDAPPSSSRLTRFFKRTYAPFILQKSVKGLILLIFGGIFVLSVISMQHIELGLDQRLALPSDSYLIPWFDAVDAFLDVGPPVYFVSTNVDVTQRSGQRALCGRFTTCQEFSVANVLEGERKRPNLSFINEPAASWIDDFLQWTNPMLDGCCRVRKNNPMQFCTARAPARMCKPCLEPGTWNITMDGLPQGKDFMRLVKHWLESPADEDCPLGGQAPYSSAVSIADNNSGITASHFRTYHKPLKSQSDYIYALDAARRIADDLSARTGTTVFPYSLFYVFFDQYAHIINITQEVLGFGLASVLFVTAILLGSWRTGIIVTLVVALTVTNVMGVMGIWGISLNALSLVNLVISLGIAVEFCSHIARAFMGAGGSGIPIDHPESQRERDERVWSALVDVGPSVLSGITFTKLIGISVLALTRSRLLEIYYFRMWLTLIVSGVLHGLVLLPVVLSLAGGQGYALEDADEEWMSNSIRRHDYEYTPFVQDDSDDSN